jgi:hypothetical protein
VTAPGEDILAWLENTIRASDLPRDDQFRDLAVLVRHNWIPYRDGEDGPSCATCGTPFPCFALRGMAGRYGWTEGER